LAAGLYSCNAAQDPLAQPPATATGSIEIEQDPAGNFVLYVSNQSFAEPAVDIRVSIDGKTAVNHRFRVGTQHNWIEFVFALPEGKHTIKAVSLKGEAKFETEFTTGKKNWAVLNYWYSPGGQGGHKPLQKQFGFELSDKPVGFA
jgi:hypothetical protein